MVSRQMYLTGSVGVFEHGEGYSRPYDLPNLKAYNETCAAIANALWNHRMFLLHGDAKYIDVLERIIYNGFLSGISLSGDTFFYPNPLACDGRFRFNHGDLVRSPWFGCSCCPVNVVRFIPSIAGYVYAQRGDEVFVNLYVAGSGTVKLAAGTLAVGTADAVSVGRQGADRRPGRTGRFVGPEAPHSRLGARPARARRPVPLRNSGDAAGDADGERPDRPARFAGRLRHDPARMAKRRCRGTGPADAGPPRVGPRERRRMTAAEWRSSADRSCIASKAPTTAAAC